MNIFAPIIFTLSFELLHVYAVTHDDAASPMLRRLSSCGALQQECFPNYESNDDFLDLSEFYEECCETTTAGIIVWLLLCAAMVVGIVVCSCACCKCCPWHDRLCCAKRQEQVNAPVAASAKQSHTESSDNGVPVDTVDKASNVVVAHQ
jgi:hypothetical protein